MKDRWKMEAAPQDQRWEFIKENKKVGKQELDQESDQEKIFFPFFS